MLQFGGSDEVRRISMAAILPGKFDDCDFDAWLREFDACAALMACK